MEIFINSGMCKEKKGRKDNRVYKIFYRKYSGTSFIFSPFCHLKGVGRMIWVEMNRK